MNRSYHVVTMLPWVHNTLTVSRSEQFDTLEQAYADVMQLSAKEQHVTTVYLVYPDLGVVGYVETAADWVERVRGFARGVA